MLADDTGSRVKAQEAREGGGGGGDGVAFLSEIHDKAQCSSSTEQHHQRQRFIDSALRRRLHHVHDVSDSGGR